RGSLADPNELSLMTCIAIPFAFAFAERRRAKTAAAAPDGVRRSRLPLLVTDRLLWRIGALVRLVPVGVVMAAIGFLVVLTQSRTGLILYLLVVGLHFVRRAGAWGIVAGCFVGPPMLVFGGRSGEEAEDSSSERVELL